MKLTSVCRLCFPAQEATAALLVCCCYFEDPQKDFSLKSVSWTFWENMLFFLIRVKKPEDNLLRLQKERTVNWLPKVEQNI